MATIRRRGRNWQAIVRRREHAESKTFTNKTDAQNWATDLEAKILRNSAGLPDSAKNYKFSELVKSYIETGKKSPRGIQRSKENVLFRLKNELGHHPAQLTKSQIQSFADKRIIAGVSPATLNMDMIYIEAVLKHAVNVLDINIELQPIKAIKASLSANGNTGKSKQRDRRPTDEELFRLLNHFENDSNSEIPMGTVIEFAIATAMRLGEICNMQWEDIDPKTSTLLIKARKNPDRKTDQLIPLVNNGELTPLKLIDQQRTRSGNQQRVFPYSAGTVSTAFRRACKKLGIVDLRFHDLRHEGISRLFEHGYQIQHVMAISGHTDLKQLSRYTNTRPIDVIRQQQKLMEIG